MRTGYVRGEVTRGMFPNERGFLLHDHAGKPISTLVSERAVVEERKLLRVDVVESRGGKSLVLIPGEVYGDGSLVTVNDSELEASP